MSDMTQPTNTSSSDTGAILGTAALTFLLFPAGLIYALVHGQNLRRDGRSQQPTWVGFAIGAVLLVALLVIVN